MASILIGDVILERGPGLIKRNEARGGEGVEVMVGVKVAVGVRVGEGPKLGVKSLVGQAVSVALSVAVDSTPGGFAVWVTAAVLFGALTTAAASGWGVADAVAVFCWIVGEGRREAVPGTLSAWQAARQTNRLIPAEINRKALLMDLSLDGGSGMGDYK